MKLTSDCCQAEIIPAQPDQFADQCSKCLKGIQYAYIGHWHEVDVAVYQAFNGDYYFFWSSCSKRVVLEEALQRGFKYLTQVHHFVTSPSAYYNRDQDRLTRGEILYVLEPWVDKVKNSEVMSKFR